MMTVFVLQPERLVKKHDFESLTVDGKKRNPHKPKKFFAAHDILDFAANKGLPLFRFRFCVQPVTDVKQRHGREHGDEALHAFAVLSAERQNRLSREPGEAARKEREY